jgi:chromosomal replication initiation ATPase DnaA
MNVSFLPSWYVPPHLRAKPRHPSTKVIEAVLSDFGITRSQLRDRRKTQKHCRARQVSWYLMRRNCSQLSYAQMARMLGRSDHSTAFHGVKLIENLISRDPELAQQVRRIEMAALDG